MKNLINIKRKDNITFGILFFILYKDDQNKDLLKNYKNKYEPD